MASVTHRIKFILLLAASGGCHQHAVFAASSTDREKSTTPATLSAGARAKPPQVKVYKSISATGVVQFSDQRPLAAPYELLSYDCFACAPASKVNWQTTPLFTEPFTQIINTVAHEQQLDKALIRAVIHAESAFNPQAISAKGAAGLMQLMPTTMQLFAVENAHEPEQNIRAGSQYLAKLLTDFNGNLTLALAAYNAGPTAVRRYNGIPPFPETQAYVERVQILKARYAQTQTP